MKKINGKQLREALISGAYNMLNDKARIDGLNVFPVPDGDTGSNMGATAEYAAKEIQNMKGGASEVASKFARGMLLGARGNSGVITSQIFKGFFVGLNGKDEATVTDIVEAFEQGKEYAYKSVMKPIEGTILTAIRITSEQLSKNAKVSHTILEVFNLAVKYCKEATDSTPDLLPVLKEVGVTDSGAEGLLLLLEGMKLSLEGKPVSKSNKVQEAETFFDETEDYAGEFGYCTEFIVDLAKPKTFKKDKFTKELEGFGGSIGVVHDDDILKVHIHTLKPGAVFTFAQKFGEFIKIKSENMTLQANETQSNRFKATPKTKEKKNIAIISTNIGNGIISDMKELGADFVIEGGQSMNPSAADFIEAMKELNSDQIIILPNNSNVILVAQQVAQTVTDKKVVVVPTKTQMQGLSALMSFNVDAKLEENKKEMTEALKDVKTGQITKASRTTKIKGVSVKKGEFLAIADKAILKSSRSKVESAIAVSKKLITDDTEIVTIYYGDNSTKTDAEEVASFIETHFDAEVEIKNGGQPLYNFLIAYE